MAGVRIVTDSACDLTEQLADDNGIVVVPLSIRFGDEELVDRRGPRRRPSSGSAAPTSPDPARDLRSPAGGVPGRLRGRARRRLRRGGVPHHLGRALLGHPPVGPDRRRRRSGASTSGSSTPGRVTMGQGLMALAAAEAAAAGADAVRGRAAGRGRRRRAPASTASSTPSSTCSGAAGSARPGRCSARCSPSSRSST